MKKQNIFFALVMTGVIAFMACNDVKTKTPALKNQQDSLSYAFGLVNGQGVKMNNLQGKGDSIDKKIAAIFKGIEAGQKSKEDKNPELSMTASRFADWMVSQEKAFLGDSTLEFNYNLFRQGVINGLHGSDKQLTPDKVREFINGTMKARYDKKMEKKYGENKKAGEKFMAENGKKPGIITTASGLQYQVISKGNGPLPKATDRVKVHYTGKLTNDSVFDSSVARKEPVVFGVNQVIPGWTEGLQLMPVGSKFKFYIPQNLAYGGQEQPKIPPFSTLVFDVELISIEK